jgi:zinc/manganese transport system substrate-binding protein
MLMKKADRLSLLLSIITGVVVIVALLSIISVSHVASSGGGKIKVVAAENFWGSLVSQIGGNKVSVYSIVSDPNADPHEYEVNSRDALDISKANYVILNGVGYDTWANKLLSASPNPTRKVLTVANLFNKKVGDNPHLWYNPIYVNTTIKEMKNNLISLDPSDSAYFVANYNKLVSELSVYQNRIKSIGKQFHGTDVAATEDIFAYLAKAANLDLVSPLSFTQAVAEGNDPPAGSIVQFEQQLESGEVKVLVYNEQTVTPLTESIKSLAAKENIPVIGITETIQPPDLSFQDWMNSEIIELQNALNAGSLGE